MHTTGTMKHWSHRLHDGMLSMRHHIDQHLHSRHFWTGVGVTLLIIGFITLFVILAQNAPLLTPPSLPYTPYMP